MYTNLNSLDNDNSESVDSEPNLDLDEESQIQNSDDKNESGGAEIYEIVKTVITKVLGIPAQKEKVVASPRSAVWGTSIHFFLKNVRSY